MEIIREAGVDKNMEDEIGLENISKKHIIYVVAMIALVLIGLGLYMTGYRQAYSMVSEFKDNYINRNCICAEPANQQYTLEDFNITESFLEDKR